MLKCQVYLPAERIVAERHLYSVGCADYGWLILLFLMGKSSPESNT